MHTPKHCHLTIHTRSHNLCLLHFYRNWNTKLGNMGKATLLKQDRAMYSYRILSMYLCDQWKLNRIPYNIMGNCTELKGVQSKSDLSMHNNVSLKLTESVLDWLGSKWVHTPNVSHGKPLPLCRQERYVIHGLNWLCSPRAGWNSHTPHLCRAHWDIYCLSDCVSKPLFHFSLKNKNWYSRHILWSCSFLGCTKHTKCWFLHHT